MPIPVTVLAIRIRAAETAKQVEDLMKYDLPADPIVRALCDRLMVALEPEPPTYCSHCGERT
jgi:hypothetical protein